MKLDIQKLAGLVQTYGARLYEQGEHIGTVVDGKDGVVLDGQALAIPNGAGGTMYVQLRRDAIATDGGTFEIHEFVAQRDAEFEYNGKIHTVKAGDIKPFASNA